VVTAHKQGSTVSISVISDDKGQYSFPASKLEPGHYSLAIRATGYDLDGTGAADVAAGKSASADLKLKKAKRLSLQMTNAEWLISMPGTEDQKNTLLGCNGCHTYQRIVRSTHDRPSSCGSCSAWRVIRNRPCRPSRRSASIRVACPMPSGCASRPSFSPASTCRRATAGITS
jgi:hypothetical protein